MKFIDLLEHATKLGFKGIPVEEEFYKICFENKDFKIEISFPNDTINEDLDDFINIDWDYSIKNNQNVEIHSESFEYYKGNAETKIQDMQEDILKHINNFAIKEFSIVEKSAFALFGMKFLRHTELKFE